MNARQIISAVFVCIVAGTGFVLMLNGTDATSVKSFLIQEGLAALLYVITYKWIKRHEEEFEKWMKFFNE